MRFERLDLRYTPSGPDSADRQTLRSLLSSQLPPADEDERELGQGRLGPHRVDVLIRDCTIDGDIPVALDDASLAIVASDVRGFGHVSWAEMAVRRSATGSTRTALLSFFGGPLIVSANAAERPEKEEEELAATRALASALNAKRGTRYVGELAKQIGKQKAWEDGVLRSQAARERRINVQVRHFSSELAKLLRAGSRSIINHDVGVLGAVLREAIAAKMGVDEEARREAHLVLISPIALGEVKRTEIAALCLDAGGYADVWLYPFGEKAFSLISG